jgi:hypothetical protein
MGDYKTYEPLPINLVYRPILGIAIPGQFSNPGIRDWLTWDPGGHAIQFLNTGKLNINTHQKSE